MWNTKPLSNDLQWIYLTLLSILIYQSLLIIEATLLLLNVVSQIPCKVWGRSLPHPKTVSKTVHFDNFWLETVLTRPKREASKKRMWINSIFWTESFIEKRGLFFRWIKLIQNLSTTWALPAGHLYTTISSNQTLLVARWWLSFS